MAFAKKGKVVYGKAFDIVKLSATVDLDDLADVEKNLKALVICEIKSTRKNLKPDFSSFFFALTGAEVLVAQSLKKQFKFVLVSTCTGEHLGLASAEIFSKAKGEVYLEHLFLGGNLDPGRRSPPVSWPSFQREAGSCGGSKPTGQLRLCSRSRISDGALR